MHARATPTTRWRQPFPSTLPRAALNGRPAFRAPPARDVDRSLGDTELAPERGVQQGGVGETAALGDLGNADARFGEPVLGGFNVSAPDLFLHRAVERSAETPLEPLPAATHRASHHRYGQAPVGVIADPDHGLADELVADREHVG